MAYSAPQAEQLGQVRSLNWLFLTFLQTSLRHEGPALGLPRSVRGVLRGATAQQLDLASAFPRALFCLELDGLAMPVQSARLRQEPERAREALTLTVLLTARNLSCQSHYQARVFLGLGEATIRRLKPMSLAELPLLARRRGLLRCAFCEAESLWLALLSQTGSVLQRELGLIAMQPIAALRCPAGSGMSELFC